MRLKCVALSGILGALMFVSQVALAPLPNVELASSLTVLFTLALGPYVGYTLAVFVLLEGLLYGFGLWWFSYLYIWAILAVAAWLFRKMESRLGWGLLCGFYGLIFGTLTATRAHFKRPRGNAGVYHQRHSVRPCPRCLELSPRLFAPAYPPSHFSAPDEIAEHGHTVF